MHDTWLFIGISATADIDTVTYSTKNIWWLPQKIIEDKIDRLMDQLDRHVVYSSFLIRYRRKWQAVAARAAEGRPERRKASMCTQKGPMCAYISWNSSVDTVFTLLFNVFHLSREHFTLRGLVFHPPSEDFTHRTNISPTKCLFFTHSAKISPTECLKFNDFLSYPSRFTQLDKWKSP